MLEAKFIFISLVLSFWTMYLREPGEVLSIYDRSLIGLDDKYPNLHKALTCSFCHCGYISIVGIICGAEWWILPLSMVLFKWIQKAME